MSDKNKRGFDEMRGPVPVTVLSGFLGAGKTTLLKCILETKHKEDGSGGKGGNNAFRCAVIVNDMAELNIDERFIVDHSDVVQSKDVIAMQNGCVCCTLQDDLVGQITKLAASGNYDYMILEASGVSEPAEIAKLFHQSECEEDHDHSEDHGAHDDGKSHLSEVSRLDTLVTVVDASALLETNQDLWLGTSAVVPSRAANTKNNLSQLLAEQVEYANVILLNKMDLVTEAQMEEVIKTRIRPLNPHATLLTCQNSRIDVHKVVDTRSYRPETFGFEQLVSELQDIAEEKKNDEDEAKMKGCCKDSTSKGLEACCPSNAPKNKKTTIDSGLSQVVLADQSVTTRHDSRFGISSFLYRARRPFHPDRFNKHFISKYFLYYDPRGEEEVCEEHEQESVEMEEIKDSPPVAAPESMDIYNGLGMGKGAPSKYGSKTEHPSEDAMKKEREAQREKAMTEAYRKVAIQCQKYRKQDLGELLRTKGFLWLTDAHDLVTTMSHAGNLVTLDSPGHWTALDPKAYNGTAEEKEKLCKQWVGQWKDRRQELVFIGQKLDHKFIQALLDECLVDDEEFEMGLDYWKATMEITVPQDERMHS